jgi:hypothetical protein
MPRKNLVAMAAVLLGLLLPGSAVFAGGPLNVGDTGDPYVWSPMPIFYRTDNGPLSAAVTEVQAQARVLAMFNVWENISTSTIAYMRAGAISNVGVLFTDGDVSNIAEFNAVETDCDNRVQNPIIYDADGTIFTALGLDTISIIGFAGPCAIHQGAPFQILSGDAVMNGLFQDGLSNPVDNNPVDISAALFDAAMIHEFGHFSGLDHSQINVNCFAGPSCTADDLEGLPTMFPYLLDVSQAVLSDDDKAWISRLYPAATFATTHGTITGTVFFPDGLSHAQFVNVIARRVNTGLSEDRRNAVSVSSGFRARISRGNPINDPTGASSGSAAAGDIGYFEIPVPAGSYTIEVEDIDPNFTGGSSVGGWPYATRIAMPGTAPVPIGPIVVGAGSTVSGNNITLIGTDPRFDQFEGP